MARIIPGKVEVTLGTMFPEHIAEARAILPDRLHDQSDDVYAVLLWLVLKLSEGSIERLSYFADRARAFPADVWLLGQSPEPAHRLLKLLIRNLLGGSVTITERGPVRMRQPDDLWDRGYITSAFHCIVCGLVVSKSGSLLPTVMLSRSGHSGVTRLESQVRVWVHYPCRAEGSRLAREQGYGWTSRIVTHPSDVLLPDVTLNAGHLTKVSGRAEIIRADHCKH
jgi:hypothetical protein